MSGFKRLRPTAIGILRYLQSAPDTGFTIGQIRENVDSSRDDISKTLANMVTRSYLTHSASAYRLAKKGYQALAYLEAADQPTATTKPTAKPASIGIAAIALSKSPAAPKSKLAPVLVKGICAETEAEADADFRQSRKKTATPVAKKQPAANLTALIPASVAAAAETARAAWFATPARPWLDPIEAMDDKTTDAENASAAQDNHVETLDPQQRIAITDEGEVMLFSNWPSFICTLIAPDIAARMVTMFRKLPADHALSLPMPLIEEA